MPYGKICKYESRFCARVNVQKIVLSEPLKKSVPDVSWSAVRMMFILECVLDINSPLVRFSINIFARIYPQRKSCLY